LVFSVVNVHTNIFKVVSNRMEEKEEEWGVARKDGKI
jgi:hypothetical protein